MKKISIKKQGGFTILEVMIAMIILSISLLLLLNMAMVALDGNDWSNKTTVATQLLQEKLEQLRLDINNLTSGQDTVSGLTREWTVSRAGNNLRRVDVSIAWESVRNDSITNTMTTFIRTDSL
jgi:type II secretion system protein I